MATTATSENATKYGFSSSEESHKCRSPGDWIAQTASQKDKWERFEVRGGATNNPRKMELVAVIENDGEPDDIYRRIEACAVACGYGHVRVSVFSKGAKRPGDMLSWPVPERDDGEAEGEDLAVNDPRNAFSACAGLLRQSYAFNQVLMNQLTSLTSTHLLHLQSENKALRDERGEMRTQVIAAERALSDREMKSYQIQQSQLRDRVLAEGATSLVQAAATHLAALPPDQSPLMKTLERLTASMSTEQVTALMNSLGGEQQAMFVSILEALKKSQGEKHEPAK